ncbi:MAG: thioesterase family protein [Hydrogenophaga sp.]|nr:thioesterase family protein [Hydrogenophaga sp.]
MTTYTEQDSSWPAEAGVRIASARVARRWTDHNGHMNLAAYLMLFDRSFARFCDRVGIGPKQLEQSGRTIFVAETHLVYRYELALGEQVGVGLRVLALGSRKMHSYLSMVRLVDQQIVCINEKMDLCVDLASRRACVFPDAVAAHLQALHARESTLPAPAWASRRVEMSPQRPA